MKFPRRLSLLVLLTVATAMQPAGAGRVSYNGLSGDDLLRGVRTEATPRRTVGSGELWPSLSATELLADGSLRNHWSDEKAFASGDALPDGFTVMRMAPDGWWTEGEAPSCDLFNLLAAPCEVDRKRGLLLPGDLSEAAADYGAWQTGRGLLGRNTVDMYAAPEALRGDIARAVMYCAVVYPSAMHSNEGFMVFRDGEKPGLSPEMYEILRGWHESDPVDEYEKNRNASFRAIQGNENPFITMPGLHSYIWGELAGQPFTDGTEDPSDVRKTLKGTYSISADGEICFSSPYVPEGAVWTVDGKAADADRISLARVGPGDHELTFEYSPEGLRGKITITVVP